MPLIPQGWVGRAAWAAWFIACVGVLLFAFQQRGIHDMPEAFAGLMFLLTFPVGYLVLGALGMISYLLIELLGLPTVGSFTEIVVAWLFLVAAGHFQWFVVLPASLRWAHRKWSARGI